jgi:4-amino-4-deoxy-L-arabinose transferase-like glycosyltransferase
MSSTGSDFVTARALGGVRGVANLGSEPSGPGAAASGDVSPRVERAVLALAVLAGLALRVYLSSDATSGDMERYLGFSSSLLAGRGYAVQGSLNTSLAPGYPVFLAALRWAWDSIPFVQAVQIAMSIGSAALVYLTTRRADMRLALAAFALTVTDFYLASLSVVILSETLTIALLSLCVYCVWRFETRRASGVTHIFFGVMCGACLLTAPHTAFFSGAVGLWAAWNNRSRPRAVAAMALGFALLFVPWQIHCYLAQGRVNPLVFSKASYAFQDSGYAEWMRTWVIRSADVRRAAFDLEKFDLLPDRAFRTPQEREALAAVVRPYGKYPYLMPAEADRVFADVAAEVKRARPVTFYVGLPVARTIPLWVEMEPAGIVGAEQLRYLQPSEVARFDEQYGFVKTASQLSKSTLSLVVYAVHAAGMIFLLTLLARAVRRRCGFPMVVALWAVCFTVASTLLVVPEARRTATFFPVLSFVVYYSGVLSRGRPGADGAPGERA